jgi:hypothetical protein
MKNPRIGILALGLVCSAASAQVLFTTQQDFAAATTASGANITVGPPGVTGDTDGSTINGLANLASPGGAGTAGALFLQENTLGYQQANLGDQASNAGFLAALKSHNQLSLDYTLPTDIVRGSGGYFEIWGVFNWSGGYQQFNNVPFFSTSANLLAGSHTVTLDYSALQAGLPTSQPGYFQMFLVINSGGTLTPPSNIQVYVDNIRAVPEPSSAMLAGLGISAVCVAARRRRS